LPKDKFKRFEQLLKNPVATIPITSDIFSELTRIFDGQNAFFNYEFKTLDLQEEFNLYLKKELNDRNFFKNQGFEQLKSGINSILVVDLPSEPESGRPEPFYYFVPIENVIDVDTYSDGQIKHIIFKLSENKIGAYCDDFYRVYSKENDTITLLSESAHGLDYCPASFFWDDNLYKGDNINKRSPITNVLSLLDRYLSFDTFKEHADLYSAFPIVVSMEKLCNFEGCQEGIITKQERKYFNDVDYDIINVPTKCPACEGRELVGAGTNFEYPARQSNEDPDLSKPVEIISANVTPLEYLTEKLKTIEAQIKSQVIGTSSKTLNTEAINELQVVGSFESRRNVLINIKERFERIHKWANDTVAILRYGDSFVGSTVFYGDEFYLKSLSDLQKEYKEAKENGEPEDEIDAIYRQIIQTKYKGNSDKIKRAVILLNLNPLPHMKLEEAKTMLDNGTISTEDYIIKARFAAFIARFERENTNVIYFGDDLEFSTKIDKINNQLKLYSNESRENQSK
jgi:hypothetical protein